MEDYHKSSPGIHLLGQAHTCEHLSIHTCKLDKKINKGKSIFTPYRPYARHHGRHHKYMISSGPKFMISLTVETFL